jgi:hypothetical protein
MPQVAQMLNVVQRPRCGQSWRKDQCQLWNFKDVLGLFESPALFLEKEREKALTDVAPRARNCTENCVTVILRRRLSKRFHDSVHMRVTARQPVETLFLLPFCFFVFFFYARV